MSENGFTPVQLRMLDVLSDGMRPTREELHTCLNDELQSIENIKVHISLARKILRPKGQDIICEFYNRTYHYRHVRLLSHSE